MMVKRTLQKTVLLAALALVLLTGGVLAQEEPVIPAQACAEAGTLDLWVWDENWASILEESTNAWIESYCPGAVVNITVHPWGQYWDLVQTAATSGDLPDVFNMSQDRFYFYASNDALLDLQPYWDEYGVDTTVWGTGLVDPYRWGSNGDLYAGPVNWDTVAIYYNKDLFDAAGLEYPTSDWTWDDFAAAAAALTNPQNDVYGAAVFNEYQSGYPNWIAATGTTPVAEEGRTACTLQDEGSIEALNFLKGLQDEGYMPTVSILGGSSANDSFAYWSAGRVAVVTGGSWLLPQALEEITFNWDVVQLPRHPETGRTRSILHSVGYVAAANTEVPDLAANLILFLSSDEGQRFFAEASGVAPANPSPELQQIWVDSFGDTDINIQAFVDATTDSQGVTAFSEIWDAINTEIVLNIFDLGVSVEEATQTACDFINTQLPETAQ
ncbi:MAG: sugar ABC transporter substrate-binding protein [bacterium]|nr:sugar ABC transporter substrate-binding protein [bacterium]